MPGEAPQTYTISHVIGDNKVVVEGFNGQLDVLPKGSSLSEGQELRGWLNPQGKYGPYLKVAQDRPQSRSNGSSQPVRDEGRDRSIERQVAAKVAGGIVASMVAGKGAGLDNRAGFAETFHFLVDTIHDAIQSGNSDDDIPFS